MPDPDDMLRRPIRRSDDGVVVRLGKDEAQLVRRLLGELRAMLTTDDPTPEVAELVSRLFPTAYPDDEEHEAEYQRLMRDELVQSKLAAFDIVDETLAGKHTLDNGQTIAFMQSINSIRLVLGVMLGVSDDPDGPEVDEHAEEAPEYALYSYLSWLLELTVAAAS